MNLKISVKSCHQRQLFLIDKEKTTAIAMADIILFYSKKKPHSLLSPVENSSFSACLYKQYSRD